MDDSGSIIALLNLPIGSIICLDGQQVALKTEDFVGFASVPSDGSFHLVTTRAAHDGGGQGKAAIGVTVGFVVVPHVGDVFVRCYDPATEEPLSRPVDPVTFANLQDQIRRGLISPYRLVSYNQFVPDARREVWKTLSCFISESFLQNHHNLQPGNKIVPSTMDDEADDVTNDSSTLDTTKSDVDGVDVAYPCIPVIKASHAARHSLHKGTKQFLARLDGSQRSALFLNDHAADMALDLVINMHYESSWRLLLADLQLSYLLFVHLHCFASLECWRDILAMLSLVHNVHERVELYISLLEILLQQLTSIDRDFFDEMDMSQNVHVLSCVKSLASKLSASEDAQLSALATRLKRVTSSMSIPNNGNYNAVYVEDATDEIDDDDDDDDPIIVSTEEVESSLDRIASSPSRALSNNHPLLTEAIQTKYSLLVAAMSPTEDILMTCARVLDSGSDVSLVREAAHYLEHVEANRSH